MQSVREYAPRLGESMAGIALSQLGHESRWLEIKALNYQEYPDMGYASYFPAGARIKLPVNTGINGALTASRASTGV